MEAGDEAAGAAATDASTAAHPLLPTHVVEASLRRLVPEEVNLVLKHKLVPTAWLPNRTYFAAASAAATADASALLLTVVGRVRDVDYRRCVRRVLGDRILAATTFRLHRQSPGLSNRHGASLLQKVMLTGFFGGLATAPLLLPPDLAQLAIAVPIALVFLAIVSLRILCLLPHARLRNVRALLFDDELPVYSVLVPLFKETGVLPQLLGALRRFEYPKDRLDIKLILEESDVAMQRAVAAHNLEDCFEVIVVPSGTPQTKPRALNYALAFARGELVTIYDAEDLPDPWQLRLAAETFEAAPDDLACVQAELAFFNRDDCWLARQFALEYASLFRVVLPALAAEGLPLPLGGTSNHFRRTVLESLGAWDPFNVTEDADLGIRLARAGYRTGVIASRTLEEANISLTSWIKQRSRWLKGFLLTWLLHVRKPLLLWQELGPAGFWVTGSMTLGVFLSAALYPVYLLKTVFDAVTQPLPENMGTLNDVVTGLAIVLFAGGYVCAVLIGRRGLGRVKLERRWIFALATMPFYWLLFMPAAWLAFYEALFRPFHWHKTQHGIASFEASTAEDFTAP